jgi:hypothetical protein
VRGSIIRLGAAVTVILGLAGCDFLYHERAVYAIEGATLMDGNALPPIAPAVVVVEEGKITAMGAASEVEIPRQAQRIDGRGKFVFPMSLSQPLKVSGPADLIVCNVNPARDPDYKKYIFGRMDNGRWWSTAVLPARKGTRPRAGVLRY